MKDMTGARWSAMISREQPRPCTSNADTWTPPAGSVLRTVLRVFSNVIRGVLRGVRPALSPYPSPGRGTSFLPVLRRCVCLLLLAAGAQPAFSAVTRSGRRWILENKRLRVEVSPDSGRFLVRDKTSGVTWRSADFPGYGNPSKKPFVLRPLPGPPPVIDGDLGDWAGPPDVRISHDMLADARKVDSDADCSARIRLRYDKAALYLAAVVNDDALRFGPPSLDRWWEKDSIEIWVDSVQVGVVGNPRDGCAVLSTTRRFPAATAAIRPAADGKGYIVEARLPWTVFNRKTMMPGTHLRIAIGVNDADATGTREGQIYFPRTWRHSDPATFADFATAAPGGRVPETTALPPPFRDVGIVRNPDGIHFSVPLPKPRAMTVLVTMTLPSGEPDLVVQLDVPDRKVRLRGFFHVLPPLIPDVPSPALAVADYCNGHLYPLELDPFPRTFFNANRLDMPWLGFVDMKSGAGFMLIVDTSDDCGIRLREVKTSSGRKVRAPFLEWWASFRMFRYPRQFRYRFTTGGYVAQAKAFRRYAMKRRLLVTLAEKARKNPNLQRLFGAPDVWGDPSLRFARAAKALGVEKMLIHGTSPPDQMRRINALGYLTSRYDNYTDILPVEPGKPVSNNRGHIPEDVVLRADGKRQTAWLTFDKKTQYMKRCPMLWLDVAKQVIPADLARYPYLARFIDVTTAEPLYECFDPNHPMTRTDKRHCGEDLEKYVWDLGLVGGGEHGIWWGVRWMCYIEGMMSGGFYSWPAGHLRHPKTKDQEFTSPWGRKLPPFSQYEKFGIGHRYRVPLWELVFHDCIVSTWYWGDASDWLLDAAPEITPKKDAFNILYGTIPLLWANRDGSWRKDRRVFLRTYRNTCKLHEKIADEEMISHEFVTPDHDVQKTVFSSGTEVVVNFGDTSRQVLCRGRKYLLPPNGFAVDGPAIRQSLTLQHGTPVTVIETDGYRYEDRNGRGAALQRKKPGVIRVLADTGAASLPLLPSKVTADWTPDRWLLYRLDAHGRPTALAGRARQGTKRPIVPAAPDFTAYDLLYGPAAERPDVHVVRVTAAKDRFTALVENRGFAMTPVRCAFYLDRVRADRRIGDAAIAVLKPGQRRDFELLLDPEVATSLAGFHCLLARADAMPPDSDLLPVDNVGRCELRKSAPPDFWDGRVLVEVRAGDCDRSGRVVAWKASPDALAQQAGAAKPPVPASVRVFALAPGDGAGSPRPVPCQFVPQTPGAPTSRPDLLLWLAEGKFPPATTRRFTIAWKTDGNLQAPLGDHWNESDRTVRMPGYVLAFANGVPVSLRPILPGGNEGPDFLESVIYSSKQTGWAEETDSILNSIHCLEDGPCRCVVRVEKTLRGGVHSIRTWYFFPDFFIIESQVTPRNHPGILCRWHFRLPGTFIDDKGTRTEVDGDGSENRTTYGRNKQPKWFAVSGKGWGLTGIAIDAFDHLAYWDGPHMGAIGFTGPKRLPARSAYVVHAGPVDAKTAALDYRRITSPPEVRILERPQKDKNK